MKKRFLTTGEIGTYCGVHFRTVIRWIEQGRLKAYRLPGGRGDNRVAVEDFLAFLNENGLPVPDELRDRSRRVLIVDDEPNEVAALRRLIQRAGFETRTAGNGLEAGAALKAFEPAVMTLDLKMPGLDGFEVLRFIRRDPGLRGMRVLVVSGLPREALDRSLECGADAWLAKPFENDALVQAVTDLAEGGPAIAASAR